MAQVVGGDRQLVAAKLLSHPAAHLLQGRVAQVGCHRWQGRLGAPQLLQAEMLHPIGLERPHLMFTGLGGGQHPNHPVTTRGKGRKITEEHLVIAQAVGGHQAVGQAPGRIGDLLGPQQNLRITRKPPELGRM